MLNLFFQIKSTKGTKMKDKAYVIWGYSLLLFVGGLIGFFKTGSWPSIIMGSFFCGVLIRYGYSIWKGNRMVYKSTLGILILLLCFFAYRLLLTHKMMPSGTMTIVTTLVLAYMWFKKSHEKSVTMNDEK